MADLPPGSILGLSEDSVTARSVDGAEAENFMKCPACGGTIDCRELDSVMAHLKPLPHLSIDGAR